MNKNSSTLCQAFQNLLEYNSWCHMIFFRSVIFNSLDYFCLHFNWHIITCDNELYHNCMYYMTIMFLLPLLN